MLKDNGGEVKAVHPMLKSVDVQVFNNGVKRYPLKKGVQVYSDNKAKIAAVADELKGLSCVQFSDNGQRENGTVLRFKAQKPVKVVVGYFNTNSYSVLEPPTLETRITSYNVCYTKLLRNNSN